MMHGSCSEIRSPSYSIYNDYAAVVPVFGYSVFFSDELERDGV